MKFKTSAIALAVAGVVAAPIVASAADGTVYASARVGLVRTSTSGSAGLDQLELRSLASRFGAKGETDLGNGMTGFGKYEWDVDLEGTDSIKLRQRNVGLKGDFGKITLGQAYHTFYNFAVGPTDNPWWGSGYAMVSYTGRTNGISYAGSAGAASFGATLYMVSDPKEDTVDGSEFGASFGIGDMTLGLAAKDTNTDDVAATDFDESAPIIGAVLTGIPAGSVGLGVGLQKQDTTNSFLVDAGFGSAYVHAEFKSVDKDTKAGSKAVDTSNITLGYTQSLGRKTTAWYEYQTKDNDTSNTGTADFNVIRAMLKYDIL